VCRGRGTDAFRPLAARSATREIPTVLIAGEPMQDGIVVSFNRPGRNATGVSLFTDVLSAKRLELVRELIPNAAVIALLVDPNSRESVIESSEVQEAAHAIGQQIIVSKAGGEPDLVPAFAGTPIALLIAGSPFFTRRRDQLVALAARYAVPTVYEWRQFTTAGFEVVGSSFVWHPLESLWAQSFLSSVEPVLGIVDWMFGH
jgi:putative ABC transport system substrate-binding protein